MRCSLGTPNHHPPQGTPFSFREPLFVGKSPLVGLRSLPLTIKPAGATLGIGEVPCRDSPESFHHGPHPLLKLVEVIIGEQLG